MLVRVKFSKLGSLKFIGHLDVMRYFQKVLSRSCLPVKYTQGFHPHQILSFASPLGVGLTSDGEYMDFELEEDVPKEQISEALQLAITDGFLITELTILEPRVLNVKKVSSMALVDSADYFIYQKNEAISKPVCSAFETTFSNWMSQPELIITKKTKTSVKEMDIKPYIYEYAFSFDQFLQQRSLSEQYKEKLCCHIEEVTGIKLYLHLSAGSSMNLKPETILEDFIVASGLELNVNDFGIHRLEMYHADEKGAWIPLWDIR